MGFLAKFIIDSFGFYLSKQRNTAIFYIKQDIIINHEHEKAYERRSYSS